MIAKGHQIRNPKWNIRTSKILVTMFAVMIMIQVIIINQNAAYGHGTLDKAPLFRGTHYSALHQASQFFKHKIQDHIQNSETLHSLFLFVNNTKEGKQAFDSLTGYAQKHHPEYAQEVKGIADGAQVSEQLVWILNLSPELSELAPSLKQQIRRSNPHGNDHGYGVHLEEEEHCSDLHLLPGWIAHNEDGAQDNKNHTYIARYQIISEKSKKLKGEKSHRLEDEKSHRLEDEKSQELEEDFVAFNYPGLLPGMAFSWNHHGLTFSMNAQYADHVNIDATPKYFSYRKIVSAKSFDHAVNMVRSMEHSFGGSTNIGIWKTESPSAIVPRHYLIEYHRLAQGSLNLNTFSNYSHFNNYKLLNVPMQWTESSIHRQARCDEFAQPTTPKDLLVILGDTKDKEYPIYRPTTLATALFDLQSQQVSVWDCVNPKLNIENPTKMYHLNDW